MAPFVKSAAAMFGVKVTLVHVCDLSSHNGFELYAGPATDIASEQQRIAELQRRWALNALSASLPAR